MWLIATLAACGGSPSASTPAGSSPARPTDNPAPAGSNTPPGPGGWSGTITFHAVISQSTDKTTESGEGLYHTTLREQSENTADATDEFTLTGSDGDDIEFGVSEVDLDGSATNSGTSLERTVFTEDKHNALGCHYLEENGSETKGPWSQQSDASAQIRFGDDGSYSISVLAGGLPESPKLPQKLWIGYTILEGAAVDCPPPGKNDVDSTNGPLIDWASSAGGAIEGQVDVANPGSVLEGSSTVDTDYLDAKVTTTWHLVHDGPINLPNDGPDEPLE